jgi:hypothetical protein
LIKKLPRVEKFKFEPPAASGATQNWQNKKQKSQQLNNQPNKTFGPLLQLSFFSIYS